MLRTEIIDHMGAYEYPMIEAEDYVAPASAFDVAAKALFSVSYRPSGFVNRWGNYIVPRYQSGKYEGASLNVYVVRDDTDDVLGLHSSKYDRRMDGYRTVVETAEQLFPNTTTSCTLFGNGERMILTQDLGEAVDVGGGDTLLPQIVWTSSLNGTWATAVYDVMYRLFCQNQLMGTNSLWKVRRTTNHGDLVTARASILEGSMRRAKAQTEIARVLSDGAYTRDQFFALVEKLVPEVPHDASVRAQNQVVRLRGSMLVAWGNEVQAWGRHGMGNRWLAYNAVQGAEQHSVNAGFKTGSEARLKSLAKSVEGKTPLAEKAHALLAMGI